MLSASKSGIHEVELPEDAIETINGKTYINSEYAGLLAQAPSTTVDEVLRRMHLGDIRAVEQISPSLKAVYEKYGYDDLTIIEDFQGTNLVIVAKFKDVEKVWLDYLTEQEEDND